MLEEDQMMRAIAMSLGQDITDTAAEDQVQKYPVNTNGFLAFVSWHETKLEICLHAGTTMACLNDQLKCFFIHVQAPALGFQKLVISLFLELPQLLIISR